MVLCAENAINAYAGRALMHAVIVKTVLGKENSERDTKGFKQSSIF